MARPHDEIAILQNNASGGMAYWQGRSNQSQADCDGVSLAVYVHALFGFLHQKGARHVLVVGGGGGTLATMLSRQGAAVTLVDINPLSFEIARRYFGMPADVACHAADGADFLRRRATRYDAIVLDAFVRGAIPRHFLKSSFFALVKSHLRRGGIFLVNIVVTDDKDAAAHRIVRRLLKTWRQVRLLDGDDGGSRNVIALAGAIRKLRPPRLVMPPRQSARAIAKALGALDFCPMR